MAKYFYAKGRRKTSTATVRLYEGKGESTINDKPVDTYVSTEFLKEQLNLPFKSIDQLGNFYFTAVVKGGGFNSQVDAIKLAISRALLKYDETLKPALKVNSLLTRDPRMVERKKAGLRKARRAEQYSKR
jgi:small subunit ribosomal protein S9